MKHILYAGAAVCALAACDGNVITVFPPDDNGGGGVPDIPDTSTCADADITCTGDVTRVAYDSGSETLTITGTPFDDDAIDGDYVRNDTLDIGDWEAYENDAGGLSPYIAYIRASTGGDVTAGVVNNDDYFDFGYGGGFYSVNTAATVPTSGLATFNGDYVGLRVFDGQEGIEAASGTVEMEVDFGDDRVRGFITARNIDGGGALPTLILNDGNIVGATFSGTAVSRDGGGAEIESGTYEGSFAAGGATSLVGIFVVTDDVTIPDVTIQETGAFIAEIAP